MLALLRQRVYGRLAGYEDVNPGAPGLIEIGAEVAVLRELFVVILDGIHRFGVPPLLVQRG